jgi:phosphoribosyl 1,2-cyclic phosphodiesterase
MGAPLKLKFWGTRGLISSPRTDTAIFGGNTTCLQVIYEDHLIIVDTGFGVTNLGEELMKRILTDQAQLNVHIFFTHFHWDHIQGLPFFHPIYFPTSQINLYSPLSTSITLANLDLLFDGSYSPFEGIRNMPSQIKFIELEKRTTICGLTIEHVAVDHGTDQGTLHEQVAYAYKFTAPSGESLVIATDHEARSSTVNDNLIRFAKNTNLLVHDGQYIDQEYPMRMGWGHSTVHQALENAVRITPTRTLLTHHDPSRSDSEIQDIHRDLKGNPRYKGIKFEFAREDVIYEVAAPDKVKKVG